MKHDRRRILIHRYLTLAVERAGWPLYVRCVEIRLKRRSAQACRALASIVAPYQGRAA